MNVDIIYETGKTYKAGKKIEKYSRNTRREKKAAETKEEIYRIAELLIRKYCPDNVSLNSIISHAGVSKGSFYLHYDSKDFLEADFITDIIGRMNFS